MARRWLILASIVLLSFFQYGSLKALEINVPRLIEQLGMSAAEAGLTCSIAAALATLLGKYCDQNNYNLWTTVKHVQVSLLFCFLLFVCLFIL